MIYSLIKVLIVKKDGIQLEKNFNESFNCDYELLLMNIVLFLN
jgi:hypothetical protein